MIRAGKLRHRVILERLVRVPDGGGGYSDSWQPVASVWVSVQPLTAREQMLAGQLQSRITHKVRMRYRPGVTADMRVRFGERLLSIIGVADIEELRVELELTCEEVEGNV